MSVEPAACPAGCRSDAISAPDRPIRQRGSSRPRCRRSGRACACTPASVRQAGGLNVTVPRSRSGTVDTSAARSSGIRPIQQRRERRGRWLLRHASDKPGALASRRGSDCQQAPAAPATAAKQGREPVARDARLAGDVVGCASGEDQGCRRRGQETCFAVRAVLRQRCQRLTEVSQLSSVSRERIRAGLAGPTPIAPGSENVGLPGQMGGRSRSTGVAAPMGVRLASSIAAVAGQRRDDLGAQVSGRTSRKVSGEHRLGGTRLLPPSREARPAR